MQAEARCTVQRRDRLIVDDQVPGVSASELVPRPGQMSLLGEP
jgi:hypothetical protein